MGKLTVRKFIVILSHAFVGWGLCAAVIGIGMAVTSVNNALILHAIGAPIFFIIMSLIYFKKFNYTAPLQTAILFIAFVIFMDIFVVALLIEKSFVMFASILGTWIPFAFIFISTYLTGLYVFKRK